MKAAYALLAVVVMAMIAISTAAPTASVALQCGAPSECVAGTGTTIYYTVTNDAAFGSTLNLKFPVLFNSTLPQECVLYNGADTTAPIIATDFTASVEAPAEGSIFSSTTYWKIATVTPAANNMGQTVTLACPIYFPNVNIPGNNSLAPYPVRATQIMEVNGSQVSFQMLWPTKPNNIVCADTPSKCGSSSWTAGAGLNGRIKYVFYPPFMIQQYDLLSISNPNFSGASDCRLNGNPAEVVVSASSKLSISVPTPTGPGEMGDATLDCAVDAIPIGFTAQSASTVTVERRYWPNPETVQTSVRFTAQSQIPATQIAVIGKYGNTAADNNDARISIYPFTPSAGAAVALVFETNYFNSELQYKEVMKPGDSGEYQYFYGQIFFSFKPDTFIVAVDENALPQCTWTLNSRVPNYNTNVLTVKGTPTFKTGTTWKWNVSVPRQVSYSSLIGQTMRIFCNGFRISPSFDNKLLPWTPPVATTALDIDVRSSTQNSQSIGSRTQIPFVTMTRSVDAEDTDWAIHTLSLSLPHLLTQDQMNKVIQQYRSTLNLSGSVVVRISTQTVQNNQLQVSLAICGIDAQPTTEIMGKLSASAATTIASSLTGTFGLTSTLSQTPARSFTLPGHCNNQIKDADETNVDCGGVDCFGCIAKNAACDANDDCSSGICDMSVCKAFDTAGVERLSVFVAFVASTLFIAVNLF